MVLLTALDPAPLREGLLPVLPLLIRRHRIVLASVADPQVADLAAARGDLPAVYGAAAAERLRSERKALRDELRLMGVEVVDADPGPAAASPGGHLPGAQGRRTALSSAGNRQHVLAELRVEVAGVRPAVRPAGRRR